jgi:hypothetical protein
MSLLVSGRPRFVVAPSARSTCTSLLQDFQLDEAGKDPPYQRGLGVVHHQLPLAHVVAERHVAAHPHAALA